MENNNRYLVPFRTEQDYKGYFLRKKFGMWDVFLDDETVGEPFPTLADAKEYINQILKEGA